MLFWIILENYESFLRKQYFQIQFACDGWWQNISDLIMWVKSEAINLSYQEKHRSRKIRRFSLDGTHHRVQTELFLGIVIFSAHLTGDYHNKLADSDGHHQTFRHWPSEGENAGLSLVNYHQYSLFIGQLSLYSLLIGWDWPSQGDKSRLMPSAIYILLTVLDSWSNR